MTWVLLMAACSADSAGDYAGDDEYVGEDLPPWSCDTEGTSTGTCASTGEVPACNGAFDCGSGEVCAAAFNGDIGPFECQAQCIAPMDDDRWCFDAAACCDASAVCDRGYCMFPEGATEGGDVQGESTADVGTSGSSGPGGATTDGTGTGR